MPEDPEYDVYQEGVHQYRAYIYSTEYQIHDFPPYEGLHDHDAPCAVCRATNRGSVMMIPAKMTCPSDWIREYHGYLMAEKSHPAHTTTKYVCVDRDPEVVTGSVANLNGALFHPVEGRCTTNLPCGPYIEGAELTCVVCSK